jgi:hypothetical protein
MFRLYWPGERMGGIAEEKELMAPQVHPQTLQ